MSGSGDCIFREAANEACREAVRRYPNSFYNGIEAARDAIRKLPAADVRHVVLCRDCKNYIERSGACAYLVVGMREDDFCSYGKRREEKLMVPWIYADLDTIIDSYSEPPKEE